jgi:hypothetical protein
MSVRLALTLLCLLGASGLVSAQTGVQRLQDVHKIYVDSLGNGDGADVIRSKVITKLVKSGKLEVVQNPDQADAVLIGASQISKTSHYSASSNGQYGNASGGTRYHATAGVQLANKDQKLLWADDASNGAFSRSASSSLADRIVKNLLKAIAKEGKNNK